MATDYSLDLTMSGKLEVNGNRVTMSDDPSCSDPGTYTWSLSGARITFTKGSEREGLAG